MEIEKVCEVSHVCSQKDLLNIIQAVKNMGYVVTNSETAKYTMKFEVYKVIKDVE